jgi:hypothetical protein
VGLITGGIDYREPVGSITGAVTPKKGGFRPLFWLHLEQHDPSKEK